MKGCGFLSELYIILLITLFSYSYDNLMKESSNENSQIEWKYTRISRLSPTYGVRYIWSNLSQKKIYINFDWTNYKICGLIPSRSMTYCGMQSVGLIGLRRLSAFSKDKAAKPNSVWKISGRLPVRSLKPPVSLSWHDKIKRSSWSALIQCKRPMIVIEDKTHHE